MNINNYNISELNNIQTDRKYMTAVLKRLNSFTSKDKNTQNFAKMTATHWEGRGPILLANAKEQGYLTNLSSYIKLKRFRGYSANKIAIIVAAGPSLKKNVDLLKGLDSQKYTIIAVDKIYNYLISKRITPDIVVTSDTHINEDEFPNCDSILFSELGSNYTINKKWCENQSGWTLFRNEDYFSLHKLVFEYADVKVDTIKTAGNVSNISLSLTMQILNPNKIILVGHDFCFYDDLEYYPNCFMCPTFIDENKNIKRHDHSESSLTQEQIGCCHFYLPDEFVNYIWYCTRLIKNMGWEDRVINSTEGGVLHLRHMMPLKESLKL